MDRHTPLSTVFRSARVGNGQPFIPTSSTFSTEIKSALITSPLVRRTTLAVRQTATRSHTFQLSSDKTTGCALQRVREFKIRTQRFSVLIRSTPERANS